MEPFARLFEQALERREALLESLHSEGTDCYRLFHGVAEGLPGLTVDRYGPLVLAQTFREALDPAGRDEVEAELRRGLPAPFAFAYNHRGERSSAAFDRWHRPGPEALAEVECREAGNRFVVRARHRGRDPWLFLDMRPGRRFLRSAAGGLSVLNLFAYTCAAGVAAAAAGAAEVWNVDFASSSLEVGRRNAILNGVEEGRFRLIEEDCIPVVRQLAGLPAGGRRPQGLKYRRFEPRGFDLVFLDPPAWAKGRFGAVDAAGDYASLFKPAALAAKPGGGRVLAVNHVPSVALSDWLAGLRRCAGKAGRPLKDVQVIAPEADFPSFDGNPPLKLAVCEL